MPLPILADLSTWASANAVLLIGVAVVAVGLFVVGRRDVPRFSWGRAWAISGVCFAESVRRKVLWIIPLAIVGLVAVVQLQQPSDEQDAIRQTTKFCLYASGLVVVLSTLILACTNLPREIENRVIFTVVTKPTTRLEIVLGKVIGFARVSFVILLTMGLFTYGYLHLRAGLLRSDLRHRLAEGQVEAISRPTLEHYRDYGLLNAKTLAFPVDMNVFGRPPVPGSRRRYLNPEGYLIAPFVLPRNLAAYADPTAKELPGLRLLLRVGYDPATTPPPAAAGTAAPAKPPAGPPAVSVQVFDPSVNALLGPGEVTPGGKPVPLADADGQGQVTVDVPAAGVVRLRNYPFVYVALSPATPGVPMWVDDDPAHRSVQVIAPVTDGPPVALNPSNPADPSRPAPLTFTGRNGTYGQQTKGDPTGTKQVCVYEFRDVRLGRRAGPDAGVPIEMRVGIEKGGDDANEDVGTSVRLSVSEPAAADGTAAAAAPTEVPIVHPENNRTLYAELPASAVRSGNFDLNVSCLSPDQWVGLRLDSVSVVRGDSTFGLNLFKSMTVLWLLAVLVTAISVFSSTFLSWPTAVVFTLVLLLGRWGLNELGDAASAGLGRQFVSDFGVRDVAVGEAVSGSVELLNKSFKTVAGVLPDISAFSATDDIDRGISIPVGTLWSALLVLIGFGLPLTVAAYVIFKNKEVAP